GGDNTADNGASTGDGQPVVSGSQQRYRDGRAAGDVGVECVERCVHRLKPVPRFMAAFPNLKTGAVAQYPAERTRRFSNGVHRFMDGSKQRWPLYGSALRRWAIRLSLLDEAELTTLEDFFSANRSFSFTDPWDGTVYPNCSFDQ